MRPTSLASWALHHAPGEEHVGGHGVGDLPRQPDRRAAEGEDPPAHLGHAEGGGLPRDADVHGLEHLGPAGDAVPLDRGDDGLARFVLAEQRLPVQVGIGLEPRRPLVVAVPARHLLEVGTGAEVAAGSGDDHHPDVGVAIDLHPGVGHPDQHLARDGVLGLGPVEGEDGDVAVDLETGVRSVGGSRHRRHEPM